MVKVPRASQELGRSHGLGHASECGFQPSVWGSTPLCPSLSASRLPAPPLA